MISQILDTIKYKSYFLLLLILGVLLYEAPEAGAIGNAVLPGATLGEFGHGTFPSLGNRTHVGLDLVAECGSVIYAFEDGKVIDSIHKSTDIHYNSLGYMVLIEHSLLLEGRKFYTIYLHMQDPPNVVGGDSVIGGETKIGKVGSTGRSDGCHTHFEIRYFSTRFSKWGNIYGLGDKRLSSYFKEKWVDPLKFFPDLSSDDIEKSGKEIDKEADKTDKSQKFKKKDSINIRSVQEKAEETITNETIIEITEAGLSDTAIINTIKKSPTSFDLSPKALINLKKKGVSNKIIETMQAKTVPKTSTKPSKITSAALPKNYGLYLVTGNKLTELSPNYQGELKEQSDKIKFLLFVPNVGDLLGNIHLVTLKYLDRKIVYDINRDFRVADKKVSKLEKWGIVFCPGERSTVAELSIEPLSDKPEMAYLSPKKTLLPGAYALIIGNLSADKAGIQKSFTIKESRIFYKFFEGKNKVLLSLEKGDHCVNVVYGSKKGGWDSWNVMMSGNPWRAVRCSTSEVPSPITEKILLEQYPLLSQKDRDNYRDKSLMTAYDIIPGSDRKEQVMNLACAATVYMIIERGRGNTDVVIDDFYIDPRLHNGHGPGAIKPNYIGKDISADRGFIKSSLKQGRPVILHGYGGPLREHFVLIIGLQTSEKGTEQFVVYDPYPGKYKNQPGKKIYIDLSGGELRHPLLDITFTKARYIEASRATSPTELSVTLTGRWNGTFGSDGIREVLILTQAEGVMSGTSLFENQQGVNLSQRRGVVNGTISRYNVRFTLSRDDMVFSWIGSVNSSYTVLKGRFEGYSNVAVYTKQ